MPDLKIAMGSTATQNSVDSSQAVASVYGIATLAIPIMIVVLTLLTFINMLIFISMSSSIGDIKSTLEDLYTLVHDQNK